MKQELLQNITGTLSITPYRNNRPAISSSATVEVLNNGGSVLVASGTTASVNSTTGEITYSLLAANTSQLGENYQIKWTYIISSVTYYQSSLFDIVKCKLSIPVVDEDLLNEQSDIMDGSESFSGAVDSAASTTLVDSDLKNYADDYWNGGKVAVINPSTGLKQVRDVTDYVQSTGTLTVGVAWATTPDSTYTFEVKRGFAKKIEAAFEEVLVDVRNKGFRPALILDSGELKIPLIKKALAMICRDFITAPDDKWTALASSYEAQYLDTFQKVKLQYDEDESGNVADTEKDQDVGNIRMRR
jgi:hypothetical protein